jgi:fatty aldehyde-generating acyl-ACP reductase
MGGEASTLMPLEFALIGHLEDWDAAASVLSALRGVDLPPIPDDELRSIVPWLPPRTICRVIVRSPTGIEARGVYIDTFIPPDRFDSRFVRENLTRVRNAAACAVREGAGIATLGGFSSILLEGRVEGLSDPTRFTTGNTMTVALIVRGIERALAIAGRSLETSKVLIIGATGDVGSGCVRYLAPRAARLLLCARNQARLAAIRDELDADACTGNLEDLAPEADVVVAAASLPSPSLLLDGLRPHAIICDAGYPKNVFANAAKSGRLFFGGLGCSSSGFVMTPDLEGVLNRHPFRHVAHGCLLEGMVLGLERRYESFSRGRGGITPERVDEMWSMAQRHGIGLAPLHDRHGSVEGMLA